MLVMRLPFLGKFRERQMRDDLTTLAVRYGTDKFGYHDYTPNYHAMFARFRDRPVRLLEIGVGGYGAEDRGGESLATWRDYFPEGRIVGIDIERKVLDLGPRVRIFKGSQVDAEFLAEVVREEGPFDLIIDDGSHRNEHVIETFKRLFPTLAPGGIYAVEDTQTAFMPQFKGGPDLVQPNSIGFFAELMVRLLSGEAGQAIADTPAEGLCAVERFHNIVALHKAGPDGAEVPVSWLTDPADENPSVAELAVTLSAGNREATSPAGLSERFMATPMGGALILEQNGVGAELAAFLAGRFAEIDHVEQRVYFPDVPLHPMASELRALTVTGTRIALWHAPNVYPSNFAFDIAVPEAERALTRMQEILADGHPWPGAIGLAGLCHRFGRNDQALELIRRFGLGEGQPRQFFETAGRVLSLTGHRDEVRPIVETGAALYPNDPKLASDMAAFRLQDGKAEAAEELLALALAKSPRHRLLNVQMGRAKYALGKLDEAAQSTEAAIQYTASHARGQLHLFLARIRLQQGDPAAARAILADIITSEANLGDRALRMLSEIDLAAGDTAAALEAIDRAIALKPDNAAYLRWRERLVS
jgi:hypothetical protein